MRHRDIARKTLKLFLDLDGVVVDFMAGIHKAAGVPYSYNEYPYELGKWDILGKIGVDSPLGFNLIDKLCSTEFWRELQTMHDHSIVKRSIISAFGSDVWDAKTLLTTSMPNPGTPSGKMLWLQEHRMADDLIMTSWKTPKSIIAGPGRLLIDDCDKNINEWRANGGFGILVPRPWNSLHSLTGDSLAFRKMCSDEATNIIVDGRFWFGC
ncbi:MAG TPA: hypothetical protein VMW36_04900 [Patescibacteria group bacterium]|nr:hypothetical protein [Patescibacteria group bacterium]